MAVVVAEAVLDALAAEPSGVTVVVGAGVAGWLLDDVEPDDAEPDEVEPEEAPLGLVALDEGELGE